MDRETFLIALDTNLLIYAHRENTPQHEAARKAVVRALEDPRGWGICLPSIAEFWSIVTSTEHPGEKSTPAKANAFIHYLVTEGHGRIWSPGPGFGERLLRWAASQKIRGKAVFDLQIAVLAYEHGAREIWTHDQRFVAVPGLKVHDPLS